MSAPRTYLDYNATAPLRPEARAAMLDALDTCANPSSVHAEGRRARAVIEDARDKVAALVGAKPANVIFTSGATEASNAVLHRSWRTIRYARIEHPCVVAPVQASTGGIAEIAVDCDGVIDVAALRSALAAAGDGAATRDGLLAAQLANNETGVIQPLAEIAGLAREYGLSVLTDAVQAAGRVAVEFEGLGVDYMLVSSHKIGGPRGAGALIVRDAASLPPFIIGGGQEKRRRAGTENVEAIAGFGAAAAAARRDLADFHRIAELRDWIERKAKEIRPDAVIVAADADRIANTSCIAVPGVAAEMLVIALDLAGLAVSAGSACASGKVGQSPVLAAMGVAPDIARAAIRVSLGHASTTADADRFIHAWSEAMRKVAPRHEAAHVRLSAGAAPAEQTGFTAASFAAPTGE